MNQKVGSSYLFYYGLAFMNSHYRLLLGRITL